jgi:hypothetical protein
MGKTLFPSPPGFDGGGRARYQARREVAGHSYPTRLAKIAEAKKS